MNLDNKDLLEELNMVHDGNTEDTCTSEQVKANMDKCIEIYEDLCIVLEEIKIEEVEEEEKWKYGWRIASVELKKYAAKQTLDNKNWKTIKHFLKIDITEMRRKLGKLKKKQEKNFWKRKKKK